MFIQPPINAVGEITAARTLHSKTFDMGGGKRRMIQKAGVPVHYEDNGFKDIDTTIIQRGNDFVVDTAPFQLVIPEGVVGFDYTSRQGGTVSLRLTHLDDSPIGALNLNPRLNGNELLLTITPALDFFIRVRAAQVQIWKIVKNPSAPHVWSWEIIENNPDNNFNLQTDLKAWDNQDDLPNTGSRADEGKLRRPAIVETVLSDRQKDGTPYTIREELTGQTVRRDPTTRVKSIRPGEMRYPVLIDQDITENIVADGDDGYEFSSTWYNNYGGGYSHFGAESGTDYHWGIRFQTVAVPTGATIDLANLQLNVHGFYGSTPRATATCYSDAVADAATWGSSSRPSQVTKSSATTTFQPTTTGDKTVLVTDQVQEIMDAGFVLNNDMRFAFLKTAGGSYQNTQMYDYAQGSTNVSSLEIDYTVGGAEAAAPPIGSLALMGVGT